MHRSHRGFTMIELIVTLTVAGVMLTVAIPRLMDHQAMQQRGFQDQLQSLLRHARKVAVSQQRSVCVRLVTAPDRQVQVNYAPATNSCNGAAVAEPGNGDPYAVDVPTQTNLTGVTAVRFDGAGRPVDPANLNTVLTTDQNLVVGTRTLRVSRETGFAYWP